MNYSIIGSDGKKVKGFVYREFKKGKLGEKFFNKTVVFNSSELLYIKSIINRKIPSEKMLLSKYVVNDSISIVGLYGISVIDFDTLKIKAYLGYGESLSRKVKSISFPVLKFEDGVKINTCSKCSEEDLKEVEMIINDFKIKNSKFFTSEQMKGITSSFKNGMSIYTGGRLRY